MAEYWLEWVKEYDSFHRESLPGGYKSLKSAREDAIDIVRAGHPIYIDGAGETIMKIGRDIFSVKHKIQNGKIVDVKKKLNVDGTIQKK